MKTKQFWYPLPASLIAQHPPAVRGTERMMVLHRDTGVVEHRHIADIVEYLTPKDLIVVNDTKVFPARLVGSWKDSPGVVEMLMVSPLPVPEDQLATAPEVVCWTVMTGSGRPSRPGQVATFGDGELEVELLSKIDNSTLWKAVFRSKEKLMKLLDRFGHTPVPPYVHRDGTPEEEKEDRARYQTIYARVVGSVAAPTAGMHFTPEIFAALDKKGVRRVAVTLHVGPGTFRPVKAEDIEDHQMDPEFFTVPPETAAAIAATKANGGRVLCVGSTSVRTLETIAAANDGKVVAGHGASTIFIYPPYKFAVTDMMLTNFHLPQSTLIMMVSALAGRERILCAYALAIRERYHFFSYGDCMLII